MSTAITKLDDQGQTKRITFEGKEGKQYDMSLYETSRWCAVLDAVGVIDKKLADANISDKTNWVKPIAIQKFVDEKYQDILHEMLEEQVTD